MATYKLHYGLQAAYDAKKAAKTLVANDLYFTSDTLCIYKGENLLSASVEAVTEFPATGAQGRIYVNTDTLESKVWNGTAWTVVSPAIETTLTGDTATGALVTAGAIRTYVAGIAGGRDLVKDVAYDETTQKITVTYGDTTTKELLLKEVITGAAYDAKTGNFTFTKANGEAVVVNTPVENLLKSAAYDEASHVLTLTLEGGETVDVNLEKLIDTYTAEATATVDLKVENNKFTANVKVSAEANNVLAAKEDGLYVAAPAEALIKSVEDSQTIDLTVDEQGKFTAKAKISTTENNQLFEDAAGLFVAATDLSNYYNKTEVFTKEEVNAAIEAAHTWEEI